MRKLCASNRELNYNISICCESPPAAASTSTTKFIYMVYQSIEMWNNFPQNLDADVMCQCNFATTLDISVTEEIVCFFMDTKYSEKLSIRSNRMKQFHAFYAYRFFIWILFAVKLVCLIAWSKKLQNIVSYFFSRVLSENGNVNLHSTNNDSLCITLKCT